MNIFLQKILKRDLSHAVEPSNSLPLVLKDIQFFGYGWKAKNKFHSYNEIVSLRYNMKRQAYNSVFKGDEYKLEIFYGNESKSIINADLKEFNSQTLVVKRFGIGLPRKELDKLLTIKGFIEKKTYFKRLYRYYKLYLQNGNLDLGYKVQSNGDIFLHNKVVSNIIDSYKKNLIEFGTEKRISRMFSMSNSFEVKIHHTKEFRKFLNNSTSIFLYQDHDIVLSLISNLLNKGYFFEWEPESFYEYYGTFFEDLI
ncbi:MAG: hypothetical protein RLN81_07485 [Balneolaceae bacterium]